jgi:hypothetical protein
MAQQCPLLFRQVDATVTRINTLFMIVGVIGFLMSYNVFILIFLITDFFLRLSGRKQLSPIQQMSLMIQKKFSLPTKMEDAGAKRLAAIFGVGFMIAILIASLLNSVIAVHALAGIFLVCAGLELLFGYCIACQIYHIAKKLYPRGFE